MSKKAKKRLRISGRKFWALVRAYAHDVPALTAAKMIGVNKNTAHDLYGWLREKVVELAAVDSRGRFKGQVEVDESYFGPWRVRGKRGRGAGRKIPVIGLLKRGGQVYTAVVPDCSKRELLPIIRGQVWGGSTI